MPGTLVIVTGPPGAGKSTVATALADERTSSAHVRGDAFFFEFLRSSFIEPWRPGSRPQNETAIAAMTAAALAYVAGGYQTFLDCVIGPWHLVPVVEAALHAGVDLDYVVLRPNVETALDRARGRTGDALRDEDPIRDLHGQFADLGSFERYVVDTTGHTEQQTIDEVEAGLSVGRFRFDPIDSARTLPARRIAICVVEAAGRLLLTEIPDPQKGVTGYRPLGGSIEDGEVPEQTVVREFQEEIGAELSVTGSLGNLDNPFVYLGRLGHEEVAVVQGSLVDERLSRRDRIPWTEPRGSGQDELSGPVWMARSELLDGDIPLYPAGLLELVSRGAGRSP